MRRRASIAATLVLAVAVSCSGGSDDERVDGSAPRSTDASGDVATTETPTPTEPPSTNSASAAIAEFDDAPLALARSLGAINESALADPDGSALKRWWGWARASRTAVSRACSH